MPPATKTKKPRKVLGLKIELEIDIAADLDEDQTDKIVRSILHDMYKGTIRHRAHWWRYATRVRPGKVRRIRQPEWQANADWYA
jgi:hypothetical protein